MTKYKIQRDDWGVCCYVGEHYDIRVERGSLSSNRPTGYNVYTKDGKSVEPFLTLKEAKEHIEYLLNK